MGYYTSYNLYFHGKREDVEGFKKALVKESNEDLDVKNLVNGIEVYAKLYLLSQWITYLSPKFPEVLVRLTGEGEDEYDRWEQRWKGDQTELQSAIIPPFRNEALKTEDEKKNIME